MFKTYIRNKDIASIKAINVEEYLSTGPDGIATDSIEGRVETYGTNVVKKIPPKTIWRILWNTVNDPLLWIRR